MRGQKSKVKHGSGVRKTFVIDTSVLLYDSKSLTSFPGNDVVIPLVVLDELDKFKDKQGLIGENARSVNRFLDSLRAACDKNLSVGVYLPDVDQNIRVEVEGPSKIPSNLDPSGDNKIIGVALDLMRNLPSVPVVVLTKDINFRVKCDALSIKAEDYCKDNVTGERLTEEIPEYDVDDSTIDDIFLRKSVNLPEELASSEVMHCEPVILKGSSSRSALALAFPDRIDVVGPTKVNDFVKFKPKNKEQTFALHMLLDPKIELVTMTGIAGSGKTFLSLMAGLSGIYDKRFKRIVITRPIQAVGKDLGFLPGDLSEKMSVWITPISDNFREGTGDPSYFDVMQERGQIEVAPLPYIRGRTFNDSFIIVDEAQNATIHELKTIITRVGQSSKVVLLGDIEQIDTPYLDHLSNGLSIVVDKFRKHDFAGHVNLPKSERSNLAAVASKIL